MSDEHCDGCACDVIYELRAEVKRLTTENACLANKLVNDIPGSYIQVKQRMLVAEGKLAELVAYLDERDALMRQVFGVPDTIEVVVKVTTNSIREILK